MFRIYVAGMFSKRDQLHEIMLQFREKGHEITYDWTCHKPINQEKTEVDYMEEAQLDARGVESCNTFVAFIDDPHYAYRGTFFELGMAIGLGKRVFVVTPTHLQSNSSYFWNMTFYHHPSIRRVSSKEDVFQILESIK